MENREKIMQAFKNADTEYRLSLFRMALECGETMTLNFINEMESNTWKKKSLSGRNRLMSRPRLSSSLKLP